MQSLWPHCSEKLQRTKNGAPTVEENIIKKAAIVQAKSAQIARATITTDIRNDPK